MKFISLALTRRTTRTVFCTTALLSAVLLLALESSAQWGSGNAVYTKQGIEISADSRITALFAMLNGQGYDAEEQRGPPPLQLPQYTQARVKARSALGRPGTGMRKFGKFIESKPGSVRKYIKATLQLGPSPTFEPQGKISKIGKGIYMPMRTWFNEEGGIRIQQLVNDSVKTDQRKLKGLLENTCAPLVESIRLGDEEEQLLDDTGPSGRVIVSLNPLDSHNTLYRVKTGNVTYLVAGASADEQWGLLVDAATFSFARTLVHQEVKKNVGKGTLGDLFTELPARVKKRVKSKEEFVTDIVACALVKNVHLKFTCHEASTPLSAAKLQPVLEAVSGRIGDYLSSEALFPEAVATITAGLSVEPAMLDVDGGVADMPANDSAGEQE